MNGAQRVVPQAEGGGTGAVTCAELVPGCLSLGWSPVNATPRGSARRPGRSASPVCPAGVHTREKRAPAD